MAKRRKFKLKPPGDGHYYASSVAEWRVHDDIELLMGSMKAGGFPFVLIWVPLPIDADYQIDHFVPEVEGCIKLAEYLIED